MDGAASNPSIANHRQAERRRAFLGATLVYGDGAFTIDCVVRDITAKGARVKVPDGQAVPDHLYLIEMRSGVAYEARVAWKRHPEIGLQFLQGHELAAASGPLMSILKRLWIEHSQRSGF